MTIARPKDNGLTNKQVVDFLSGTNLNMQLDIMEKGKISSGQLQGIEYLVNEISPIIKNLAEIAEQEKAKQSGVDKKSKVDRKAKFEGVEIS